MKLKKLIARKYSGWLLLAALAWAGTSLPPAALAQGTQPGLWDVYQLALIHDPQLRAAEASLAAVSEAKAKALSALLPSVYASGGGGLNHFENKNPTVDPKTGLSTSSQDYDARKYGIYLSQPVVNLPTWTQMRQASYRVAEGEATYKSSQSEFLVRLLERYLKVLGAADNLHWIRASKQAITEGLARARKASELGLEAPLAAQKAQASYDLAEADEIGAENQLQAALDSLAEITAARLESLAALRPDLPLVPPAPNDVAYWRGLALKENEALVAKENALEGARLEIFRQRAGHLPSLNLTANHYYENVGGGKEPGEDVTSTVMLELRVPIFEGGGTEAQTREARALHDKSRQEYEGQRRQVMSKVEESFRGMNENIRRVKALQQAVKSSLAAMEGAKQGISVGSGTMVEFLEAMRDLYRARRDLTQARHEYLLNWWQLLRAAGRLGETDLLYLSRYFRGDRAPQLLLTGGEQPFGPPEERPEL